MSALWRKFVTWAGLVILALALAVAAAPTAPAQAAPAIGAMRNRPATGDTLTLSLTNGPTVPYTSSSVLKFVATAKLATPLQPGDALLAFLTENGQTSAYAVSDRTSAGPDGVTYTMPMSIQVGNDTVSPGTHIVYAYFVNPDTKVKVISNTVSFTISPINEYLMCDVGGPGSTSVWKPGQSVTIAMLLSDNPNSTYHVEWAKGTVTITVKGPTTTIFSHLPIGSDGLATITAPSTPGYYALDCVVSGIPYYNMIDTGFGRASHRVSAEYNVGAATLYTNPRTIVSGVPIQMYFVIDAAPGVPAPTGTLYIYIGYWSGDSLSNPFLYVQNGVHIGSGGTTSISLEPLSLPYGANTIEVSYSGDINYRSESWTFSLTNPSISGGGGGGGGVGTAPKKPTATPKPHPTATAVATATATAAGATISTPAGPPANGATPFALGAIGPLSGGGLIDLIVLIVLLALGGGVGTFALISRRGASATAGQSLDAETVSPAWPAPPLPDAPTLPDGPSPPPVDGPFGG